MPRSDLDDCFAHPPERLSAAAALGLLRARMRPVAGSERVPLDRAHGRILAERLISDRDVPGVDNAAVDGYAIAHHDLQPDRPTRLGLLDGRAAAGHPHPKPVPRGMALRVLTGAAMPAGTDTVIMQEDCQLDAGGVVLPAGVRAGANRRLAGEDMRRGQTVLGRGRRLRPQEVGVAAGLGRGALEVFRPLEVALFSTGDELREPGQALRPGDSHDINRPVLKALLEGLGCAVTDLGIVGDRPEVVQATLLDAARHHHVIVTSGGASRGDEDHVVRAVERLGRLDFWQLAIKPGRPLAFGQLDQATFVGLPGNPVAAMVCFVRFTRPALVALGGGVWPEPAVFRVPADFAMTKKAGRREYLRAGLVRGAADHLWARKVAREGSGISTSLSEADGLVELAEDTVAVSPGDLVDFVPFSELGVAG